MAGNEASNTEGNTGGNNQQKSVEQTKKELLAQLTKELGLDAAQGNYKQEYVQQIGYNPAQIKEAMSGVMQATAQGLADQSVFTTLDEQATSVSNSFGIAKGRMEEFRQVIADASPTLVKLGIDQTEAAANYTKIADAMGGAVSMGTEAIVEMSAAAKISGTDAGQLAAKFREVGVSVYDAGDQMKEVANYARNVGVSVSAVSTGVLANLNKLNTMNFQGGVEGLTRMAAQAARLGVDMGKVLQKADELMDPDKAIDMAASLQRLGVTSSALLDPLRAMDMAQNDPEALQNEMLNISKEFTKFNEQSGKFEIMPGAKRRLKEVAGALGMNADELAKMSIQSAEFDKKLSQLKLPSFAEGDEETKQLIAGMAQMKGGVATVNVKDEKTGEVLLKQVDQLTPEDIQKLKESQTQQAKSVEELAYDQLTQLQQINSGINGVKAAAAFGTATAEPIEKLVGTLSGVSGQIAKDYGSRAETKDFRKGAESIGQPIEDVITAAIRGDEAGQKKAVEDLFTNLKAQEENFVTNQTKYIQETFANVSNVIKENYSKPVETKTTADVNLNMNVNVTGDANSKNMSKEDWNRLLDEKLKDPSFVAELQKLIAGGSAPKSAQGAKV